MNPKQLFERLTSLTTTLSTVQLTTLGVTFLAVVVFVVGSARWLNTPSYRLLYSDLDPASAAEIVSYLDAAEVPFRLNPGGTTISVPATAVDRLRLDLAGQDLPMSGRIGFEIFDRTAFGATEFQEQVNLRRALEGEIARTIGTLSEVASARVHIAMAKPSIFATQNRPAKASVVLKLRRNSPLSPGTTQAISSLVAASVEGLGPEGVVVIDSFGRSLSRPPVGGTDPAPGLLVERQQQLERTMAGAVVSLLEPVIGPGRVRVNVSVELDPVSEEATAERWDPASAVVRSRQVSAGGAGGVPVATGLAGVAANRPPPGDVEEEAAAIQADVVAARSSGSETTNYEIDRSTSRTVRSSGAIARLAVAVLVDDAPANADTEEDGAAGGAPRRARDTDEMRQIEALVAAAVGLDPARGDQLTVENISFEELPQIEEVAPRLWERYLPQLLDAARIATVLVVGLVACLVVVRLLIRRTVGAVSTMSATPTPVVAQTEVQLDDTLPRTIEEVESELDERLTSKDDHAKHRLKALSKRVGALTELEPEGTARVVRAWLEE